MSQRKIIAGLFPAEIKKIMTEFELPDFRTNQVLNWVYRQNVLSFQKMQNLPLNLRQRLAQDLEIISLETKDILVSSIDKTKKYIFNTSDDEIIEAVFIPTQSRATTCVSTQIGCAFGCIFCASGLCGLKRNLTPDEIVSQALLIKKDNQKKTITNIVIMGMGEPLANYDNVMKAIRIFNNPECLGLAARKITISTCGLPKEIMCLAKEKLQVELSISLHAASDELRDKLIPINKKYPLTELIKVAGAYTKLTNRIITFEYVLIDGTNDRAEDARNLARLLANLKCKINLIPFNPVAGLVFSSVNSVRLDDFKRILKQKKLNFTVRRQRGQDINGACGQLRRKFIDKLKRQSCPYTI